MNHHKRRARGGFHFTKKHISHHMMNILELSEQEIVRRQSLEQMRQLGIEPYPAAEYTVNGYTD